MNHTLKRCVLAAVMLAMALPAFGGEAPVADTLEDAIKNGQPLLTFRYRYEEVDQDGIDANAHASTLRTTVGYRSGAYKGFNFLVEAEDVTVVGDPHAYNNGTKGPDHLWNGVTGRPVVADPANTSLNQAYFQWKNSSGTNQAHVGRREIIIGDARFVGNVGWRQNHQSFDAFAYTNTSLDFLDWSYRYVDKVNRIFGDVQDMASHLVNADVKVGDIGKLGLYGYMLDYTRDWNYGMSTATIGAEFKGKLEASENVSVLYEVEYASQSDYGDNPNDVEASYYHIMAGAALKPVTFKVGYEVLSGDLVDTTNPNDKFKGKFTTPLATLHKWNGWADKFLGTPDAGLEDLYFLATGNIGPVKGLAVYHIFKANDGGSDFGKELDIQFTYKTSWKQTFGVKGAFYSTDITLVPPATPTGIAADTTKMWVFTSYSI